MTKDEDDKTRRMTTGRGRQDEDDKTRTTGRGSLMTNDEMSLKFN